MPLGDSVLEKISQDVLTTLQGITTGNGYAVTLDVVRGRKLETPKHLHCEVWQLSPDDVTDQVVAADMWEQHYAVVCYVQPDDTDTTALDVYNNQIAAAIHFALLQDVTRTGNAMNTTIKPTFYFPPVEGEAAGITVNFTVLYRTALDDPYTPAN